MVLISSIDVQKLKVTLNLETTKWCSSLFNDHPSLLDLLM